ncbi:MAG TPA: YcnI family protein [Ilumatobacteraceae bacterium]|nr:YcnI family protein [Ilumatobacteraceae bacterium]
MSARSTRRVVTALALACGASVAIGAHGALAHVGTDKSEITAGASTTLTFAIGHGCDDLPTREMKFQIPDSVLNAAPQMKPGWTITTEREDLAEPVESAHGPAQTDRVSVITFTATDGFEVDPHYRDTFTLAFRAPAETGTLFFKTIQDCGGGNNYAWIEEWDGAGAEPDSPAPSVEVVAATDGDDDGHGAAPTTAATTAPSVTVGGSSESGSDSDSGNGLAIAALIVAIAGVGVGGAALARSRRPQSV